MEQKTRSKFLPWPGWNLGPWHLEAADVATRLPRTPPFSRFLQHAGGYSRTILTPNLQGCFLIYFYSFDIRLRLCSTYSLLPVDLPDFLAVIANHLKTPMP